MLYALVLYLCLPGGECTRAAEIPPPRRFGYDFGRNERGEDVSHLACAANAAATLSEAQRLARKISLRVRKDYSARLRCENLQERA